MMRFVLLWCRAPRLGSADQGRMSPLIPMISPINSGVLSSTYVQQLTVDTMVVFAGCIFHVNTLLYLRPVRARDRNRNASVCLQTNQLDKARNHQKKHAHADALAAASPAGGGAGETRAATRCVCGWSGVFGVCCVFFFVFSCWRVKCTYAESA